MEPKETHDLKSICIVGMGFVGLPLAIEFSNAGHDVYGYDINPNKINKLQRGIDPTGDLDDSTIDTSSVNFTSDAKVVSNSDYIIVTVPTPVDDLKNPDLKYIKSAGETIGKYIKKGSTVILESTVYPGATRQDLVPSIESTSELEAEKDFNIGYSPERIVPGDSTRELTNIIKIVSGQDEEVTSDLSSLYNSIIDAGIHKVSEIEAAEAAKCIENIQRDINIAMVNELAVACDYIGLDTSEVLEAAGTKWNFHEYEPGLVGGHCIPVDPFQIINESKKNGFTPRLVEESRRVNDFMPEHVADIVLRGLNESGKVLKDSNVLVLGLSYKPNVSDTRTSAVSGTVDKLQTFGVNLVGYDPVASNDQIVEQFGIDVQSELSTKGFDAILMATAHDDFSQMDYNSLIMDMNNNPLLVDASNTIDQNEVEKAGFNFDRI